MPVDEGSLSEAQLQQLRDHHYAVEQSVLPAISHEMAGMLAANVDTPNALTQSANTGDLVPVIEAQTRCRFPKRTLHQTTLSMPSDKHTCLRHQLPLG